MVLESITNPFQAENKPSLLIALGFVYCVVAVFLATWIFRDQASLVFVFLVVMAAIPLMINIIKEEEKKDLQDLKEVALLKEHSKALKAFMALFLGITLGVVATYTYTPVAIGLAVLVGTIIFSAQDDGKLARVGTATVVIAIIAGVGLGLWSGFANVDLVDAFDTQIDTIKQINGRVTGYTSSTNTSMEIFSKIFFNNIKVLIFCILFSFLYGSGAIFILTWNASVIGAAIGNFVRNNLAAAAHLVGLERFGESLSVITIGLFRYVIHGVPEILGYFVAALAGGIISIGVIRHDFQGRKFEHIILDTADLILLSVGIIFVAAILEVWVTPIIF